MMKVFTDEIRQFIADNVAGATVKQLTERVNSNFGTSFTEYQIKSYKSRAKLRSGTLCGVPSGLATKLFPDEVQQYIKDNYTGTGYKQMADALNSKFGTSYTAAQISSYYGNRKLNSGLNGRFEKGLIPFNKGRKGYCYPGCEKTQFRKGNVPKSHLPVGSEKLRDDGYWWVKTAEPNIWKQKHRLLWEAAHGEIPKGYIVTLLDGNRNNITLENLEVISMSENSVLNKTNLRSKNPEFTKIGIAVAKIKVAVHSRKKKGRKNAKTGV